MLSRMATVVLTIAAVASAITLTKNQPRGGRSCYKIATQAGTYYYDPEGAGLASFVDKSGKDWISFSTTGPNGQSAWYRGIPNAVHNQDVSCFHPKNSSTKSSTSTITEETSSKITIKAVCGNWKATWDFYETRMDWTLTGMTSGRKYWFLYEGTPYGKFSKTTNYLYRSDTKTKHYLGNAKSGDIEPVSGQSHEWIYFSDNAAARGLLLVHHTDDTHGDRYYAMDPMTVFGFGRPSGANKELNTVPNKFSITFVETTDWDQIAAAANGIVTGISTGSTQSPSPAHRPPVPRVQSSVVPHGLILTVPSHDRGTVVRFLDIGGRSLAAEQTHEPTPPDGLR